MQHILVVLFEPGASTSRETPSASLFHCLESSDHRFDTRPDLLIFLQQSRAFSRQRILTLFQRSILVLELIADMNERIYALLQSIEFVLELFIYVVSHAPNIEAGAHRINRDGPLFRGESRQYMGSFALR